jgi:hypothetical protein
MLHVLSLRLSSKRRHQIFIRKQYTHRVPSQKALPSASLANIQNLKHFLLLSRKGQCGLKSGVLDLFVAVELVRPQQEKREAKEGW